MYVIFCIGNKQYLVKNGQIVFLEKINLNIGKTFYIKNILSVFDKNFCKIGFPVLNEFKVEAKVISHYKHKKIRIIKFNRRKNSRKKQGHRQWITKIKVLKIINNFHKKKDLLK